MEVEKTSNLGTGEALARRATGLSALVENWVDRFLRFGCMAGSFSGGVGLSLYGETLHHGRKSQAEV